MDGDIRCPTAPQVSENQSVVKTSSRKNADDKSHANRSYDTHGTGEPNVPGERSKETDTSQETQNREAGQLGGKAGVVPSLALPCWPGDLRSITECP